MKKTLTSLLALSFLVSSFFLMSACTKPTSTEIDPDGNAPQKGMVSVRALDAVGKPLANASIVINNSQYYNHNVLGQTDANGRYNLQVTPGSWYVRGTVKTKFDNKTYVLDLHPDNDVAFAGSEGAVRNLTLKVSGERTGEFGNDGYYGGKVEVFTTGVPTNQVTLTLQPVGSLIDGSTGRTITTKPTDMYIHDVPLGKYTVTAQAGNQPLQVRIRNADQSYGNSVTASFDPAYPGAEGRYKLNVEVQK